MPFYRRRSYRRGFYRPRGRSYGKRWRSKVKKVVHSVVPRPELRVVHSTQAAPKNCDTRIKYMTDFFNNIGQGTGTGDRAGNSVIAKGMRCVLVIIPRNNNPTPTEAGQMTMPQAIKFKLWEIAGNSLAPTAVLDTDFQKFVPHTTTDHHTLEATDFFSDVAHNESARVIWKKTVWISNPVEPYWEKDDGASNDYTREYNTYTGAVPGVNIARTTQIPTAGRSRKRYINVFYKFRGRGKRLIYPGSLASVPSNVRYVLTMQSIANALDDNAFQVGIENFYHYWIDDN